MRDRYHGSLSHLVQADRLLHTQPLQSYRDLIDENVQLAQDPQIDPVPQSPLLLQLIRGESTIRLLVLPRSVHVQRGDAIAVGLVSPLLLRRVRRDVTVKSLLEYIFERHAGAQHDGIS